MMSIDQWCHRAHTQADRKRYQAAGLQTKLKLHKLDNIKYLAGFVSVCLTEALGFYHP